MATAAVIDFGSFSSDSHAERVQSRFGSRIEPTKIVDAGYDRCSRSPGNRGVEPRCARPWMRSGLWCHWLHSPDCRRNWYWQGTHRARHPHARRTPNRPFVK